MIVSQAKKILKSNFAFIVSCIVRTKLIITSSNGLGSLESLIRLVIEVRHLNFSLKGHFRSFQRFKIYIPSLNHS
jgi:hypothetical protein